MDATESQRGASEEVDRGHDHSPASSGSPKELPEDLPKSLDDRRSVPVFQQETEMYDAWQGEDSLSTLICSAGVTCAQYICVPAASFLRHINMFVFPDRTIAIPYNTRRGETP